MLRGKFGGIPFYISGSFADNFNIPNDGILRHLGHKK